ncbi:hypothetical protein K474DRAFT_1663925 [Panus rudis PR-1116 ss-1]|nr:hypothetical protein K474DRAFT_1663925 [Panus rudis PR-1116 ss-1]
MLSSPVSSLLFLLSSSSVPLCVTSHPYYSYIALSVITLAVINTHFTPAQSTAPDVELVVQRYRHGRSPLRGQCHPSPPIKSMTVNRDQMVVKTPLSQTH